MPTSKTRTTDNLWFVSAFHTNVIVGWDTRVFDCLDNAVAAVYSSLLRQKDGHKYNDFVVEISDGQIYALTAGDYGARQITQERAPMPIDVIMINSVKYEMEIFRKNDRDGSASIGQRTALRTAGVIDDRGEPIATEHSP